MDVKMDSPGAMGLATLTPGIALQVLQDLCAEGGDPVWRRIQEAVRVRTLQRLWPDPLYDTVGLVRWDAAGVPTTAEGASLFQVAVSQPDPLTGIVKTLEWTSKRTTGATQAGKKYWCWRYAWQLDVYRQPVGTVEAGVANEAQQAAALVRVRSLVGALLSTTGGNQSYPLLPPSVQLVPGPRVVGSPVTAGVDDGEAIINAQAGWAEYTQDACCWHPLPEQIYIPEVSALLAQLAVPSAASAGLGTEAELAGMIVRARLILDAVSSSDQAP